MATTIVSHIPIKCSSSISTPSNKHHQAIKPCCSKPIINNYYIQQHLSKPTESSAFSRREAIGFGLCLNFFDTLLPASAAAESNTATGAAACEFTVADSGLAFCDKVVGYGSQAEKGQLIKVKSYYQVCDCEVTCQLTRSFLLIQAHYVGKLVSGKVFDSSYNRGKPLTFRIGVGEVTRHQHTWWVFGICLSRLLVNLTYLITCDLKSCL